jgi:hypothetical protein
VREKRRLLFLFLCESFFVEGTRSTHVKKLAYDRLHSLTRTAATAPLLSTQSPTPLHTLRHVRKAAHGLAGHLEKEKKREEEDRWDESGGVGRVGV